MTDNGLTNDQSQSEMGVWHNAGNSGKEVQHREPEAVVEV